MKAILIISIVLFDPAATTTIREFSDMPSCIRAMENVARGYGISSDQINYRNHRNVISVRFVPGFSAVGQASLSCSPI